MDALSISRDREILEAIPTSVCAFDLDLTITYWNDAAERLYGWSRDEAIGRTVLDLFKRQYDERIRRRWEQLLRTGRIELRVFRHAKDGSLIAVDGNWAVRRDAGGAPIEIVETTHPANLSQLADASSVALIAAYEALAESEKKYRDLFNVMPIAIWQMDSRPARKLFDDLRANGIGDLTKYMRDNPRFLDEVRSGLKITEVNEQTLSLFGATDREDLLERMPRLWFCCIEDLIPVVDARLSGAQYHRGEATIEKMDGTTREILFSAAFSNRDDPESLHTIGAVDISEEKRAKEALAESEKKYRDLFNFMPIAIWQLNSRKMREMFDGLRSAGIEDFAGYLAEHPEFLDEAEASLTVTEANERTLHLFGATDREELLKAMPSLWQPGGKDWVAASIARQAGAKYYSRESVIRRMDGSHADVLFSVAFSNPDDPESLNTVGAIDITEEKRAKELLKQSEHKYRTLFQYMPIAKVQIEVRELLADFARLRSEGVDDLEAYISANPEFLQHAMQVIRVVEGNDLCCRMFGAKDSAELCGPVDRFFKVRPDTLTQSLAARYSGAERFMSETRLSTLDGRVLDLLYTSAFSPELSELGIGLVGMIDIGDRLTAERKLQQIEAEFIHAARVTMLGELTASIAHEVNQPLTAISVNGAASLRWLGREPPDVGEARNLASHIVADATRAGDIISRIRNMAAHKDPRRDPVDLGEVARETIEFLRRELQVHQIKVELQLPKNVPLVIGDRTQLQQVVLNLVVNAVDAMRDQGTRRRQLTIHAARDGDQVKVMIEDLGPGVPNEDRGRLFAAFFSTKKDGLGLGLSICRTIIDSHGGKITYEPLPIGARFVFSVPVAEDVPEH